MEYKKERNVELDATRGLAILLVVLGHSIQCSNGMNPGHPLQQIIMTFWMPLFFILSGFTDGMTGGGSLMGRVRRLLIPYLFWVCVVYVSRVWRGNVEVAFGSFIHEILYSDFWFLRVLFLTWLPCYCFRRVRGRFNQSLGIAALLTGCFVLEYALGVLHHFPLYLTGIALWMVHGRLSIGLQNVLLGLSVVVFGVEGFLYFNFSGGWLHRLIDLSMAFSGSAAVFALIRGICLMDCFARLKVLLSFAGRYTLELYAVHWCLLFNLHCGFASWPILFLLWCIVSGLLVWVIYQIPVLPLVAFGRTLRCHAH